MEFTQNKIIKVSAILLFLAAVTQAIYTLLAVSDSEMSRAFLWKAEAIIFVLLTAFAGAVLASSKRYGLIFSAIAFSAVLNIVQVGIGLVQFKPFFGAAGENPELAGIASSVLALSFFIYNGAKMLLGLAALVLGMDIMKNGAKPLGAAAALIGAIALITNAIAMIMGRSALPEMITAAAGGSGVIATLLLAVCLFSLSRKDIA